MVLILRSQHSKIIQTVEQYKFIYFAIADFVETQRKLQTVGPNYAYNFKFAHISINTCGIQPWAASMRTKEYH